MVLESEDDEQPDAWARIADFVHSQDAFIDAAQRAGLAGFDVLKLHGAHGYLLLELTDGVRQGWPADKPLFVRVSATNWTDGGWDGVQAGLSGPVPPDG